MKNISLFINKKLYLLNMSVKLKILTILFFISFFSFLLNSGNRLLSSSFLFFCMILVIIGLFQFLATLKMKRVKKFTIEFAQFTRNYVIRIYLPLRRIWIIYDKKSDKFRVPDVKDIMVKIVLTILFGLISMYISFTIILSLKQMILTVFRLVTAFILGVVGLYAFIISLARMFSRKDLGDFCGLLNKDKKLKEFLKREKIRVEITPNFLLTRGLVTSVEFVSSKMPKGNKVEKFITKIANVIAKS
jgi:hypothetical protein